MGVIKSHQHLSKQKIEDQAGQVLAQLQAKKCLPRKWSQLADAIADFLDLGIVWESFEVTPGEVVAAKIYPTTRQIELNNQFQALHRNEGFYQSTLAHEIGHWVLHVNQAEADGLLCQGELLLDAAIDRTVFLCRTVDERAIYQRAKQTQEDWREWQAQYFASCLLMPRFKIEEVRQGRNLLNWSHLNAIQEELGVSKRNLLHRLKDLEFVQESGDRLYPGKNLKSGEPLLAGWHESSVVKSL